MVLALLVLAIVCSAFAAVVRRRFAVDGARSDAAVLTVDAMSTVVTLILFGVAAVLAASMEPVDGALAIATKAGAVVAAAVTGASVVRVVLAAGGIPTRGDNHDDEPDAPLRGGRVIGMLERVGVATTVLLAWPAGIGVILAVKSLARFSELRAPRASEQFILGTFASVLWAVAAAGIGHLAGT